MKFVLPLFLALISPALLAQTGAVDDHPMVGKQILAETSNSAPPAAVGKATNAAAPAPVAEADAIPPAYRSDRYQATWAKNPFLIKVAGPTQNQASFAEDWELKYLNDRNGVVKAGIQNRKTQEYRNVTSEPDAEGFRLVKATISRNRKDSSADVAKGAETATLRYSDTPTAAAPRPGVVPGQPGAAPGVPPRTGTPPAPAGGYRAPGAAAGAANMAPRGAVVPPGVNPAAPNPNTPPNAVNRRRVLIPSPAPAN